MVIESVLCMFPNAITNGIIFFLTEETWHMITLMLSYVGGEDYYVQSEILS